MKTRCIRKNSFCIEQIEVKKSVKVVLNASFVGDYLRQQNATDADQNRSIISLNDSVVDTDVVFVAEKKASRDEQQIAKLNQKIFELKNKFTKNASSTQIAIKKTLNHHLGVSNRSNQVNFCNY